MFANSVLRITRNITRKHPEVVILFFDAEYRNKYVYKDIVVVSFFNSTTKEVISFRSHELDNVAGYVEDNIDNTFACYTAAADLPVLITLGVDVRKLSFMDVFVLYKQLSCSHTKYLTEKPSLAGALDAFGIDVGYGDSEKFDTVKMILSATVYSSGQWDIIQSYCEKDVAGLAQLTIACLKVISEATNVSMGDLRNIQEHHGVFLTNVAMSEYGNLGFPVNTKRLYDIYDNIDEVKAGLAEACNKQYCKSEYPALYVYKKTKHRDGTFDAGYSFNNAAFEDFIKRSGLYSQWDKTDTGKLSTKQDVFVDKIKGAPYLSLLYRTRRTFQQVGGKLDLRTLHNNGYVKNLPTDMPMSRTYGTRTYRASPLPAHGFILNMTPWLRCALIEPQEGMAFVGCDWSAQEIAIAASMSRDENMRDMYNQKRNGGDIYLFMAKKAGSAPEDATPKTHGKIRGMFKIVQLGLGYGMGVDSLSDGIYNAGLDKDGEPTVSRSMAYEKADEISDWHHEHFYKFWEYVEDYIEMVRDRRYHNTLDGLVCFLSRKTWKQTQIQNYPIQSAAGVMMRVAYNKLVDAGLDVVCSHHDAFYLNCKVEDAEKVARELERCMNEASDETIGDFCPVLCEAKIQYHNEWYKDERGDEQLQVIGDLLGWNNNNNKLENDNNEQDAGESLI